MMAVLFRKELVAFVRDGRFIVLGVLAACLLVVVGVTSSQATARRSTEVSAVERLVREQWDLQGDKHPHRGAHFGLYAFRPPAPLEAFDPGIRPQVGQAVWLEPHRRNLPRLPAAADALPSQRFGGLTPAFLLITLSPLLLIAFGFASFSQEKESGTLRMLQGTGVPPHAIARAKLAALVLAFGVVTLLPLGAAMAPGASDGPDGAATRWAVLMATLLAYVVTLAALVLAVSARSSGSGRSLLVLIGLWVGFAFIVPRAGAWAAQVAYPLPTPERFWEAIQRDYTQGLPGEGTLAERGKRFDAGLLRRYGVARLEDLPVGAAPLRRLERDAYADKVHALHFGELWRQLERQQHVARLASLLSPVAAMRQASMALAGTDLAHQREFEEAAERYRQRINRSIDTWDAENTRGMTSFESRYADDRLWQSAERFRHEAPTAAFALRNASADLALLGLWLAGSLAFLAWSLRRWVP